MTNRILGVEMGEWQRTPTLDVRHGHARGVTITQQRWHNMLRPHTITVTWDNCNVGIGSFACERFDEALSKLRRGLVQVGHRVFGQERSQ